MAHQHQPEIPESEPPVDPRSTVRQYGDYPVTNFWDKVDRLGLYTALGITTPKGKIHNREGNEAVRRPLSVRKTRADLMALFHQEKNQAKRQKILAEAHDRDTVAKDFLKQGEVSVTLSGGGTAKSRFTEIQPPGGRAIPGKPPVVFIPGICNDLESVDTIVQELAMRGRTVICIGYPASRMGTIDADFASNVAGKQGFGPHAEYFKSAIRQLLPGNKEFELWGFSTGGPVAAKMLTDDAGFSNRVTNAAFLNPAAAVKQSTAKLRVGMIHEAGSWLFKPSSQPSLVYARGRKNIPGQQSSDTAEQLKHKNKVFESLLENILRPADWSQARVREGGSITVLSCLSDKLTRCAEAFSSTQEFPNKQMRAIEMRGIHSAPLLRPAKAIRTIELAQKRKSQATISKPEEASPALAA